MFISVVIDCANAADKGSQSISLSAYKCSSLLLCNFLSNCVMVLLCNCSLIYVIFFVFHLIEKLFAA